MGRQPGVHYIFSALANNITTLIQPIELSLSNTYEQKNFHINDSHIQN